MNPRFGPCYVCQGGSGPRGGWGRALCDIEINHCLHCILSGAATFNRNRVNVIYILTVPALNLLEISVPRVYIFVASVGLRISGSHDTSEGIYEIARNSIMLFADMLVCDMCSRDIGDETISESYKGMYLVLVDGSLVVFFS